MRWELKLFQWKNRGTNFYKILSLSSARHLDKLRVFVLKYVDSLIDHLRAFVKFKNEAGIFYLLHVSRK